MDDDVKTGVLALAMALSIVGSQAHAAAGALVPGDRIGSMRVARMEWSEHLPSIFTACDPLITKPGFYHRRCIVPRFDRIFIGFGDFRGTLPALNRAWRGEQWQLYVDGHEVYLPAFGTDWRILIGYPAGAYQSSVFREWRVALVRPTRGRHVIRYISIQDRGVVDVTFTVRIA
jgi:hypothetical protein